MERLQSWLLAVLATAGLALSAPAQGTFIDATVVATSGSSPGNFAITFTLPVFLTGIVSYTGTLTADLTDSNQDGVTLSPNLGSLFEGAFDGTAVDSDSIGALTSDLPATIAFSGFFDCGAGCTTMSVLLHFSLTPFDTASLTARFEANPAQVVPEPATVALLALGLGAIGVARRRTALRPVVR